MATSQIEWTESTWNPVSGCNKVSPGCKNCYAERMSKRLQAMKVEKYKDAFELRIHEDALIAPLNWKKPRKIFVNSMSDLFHEAIPSDFIQRAFQVMQDAHWHQFQVLTKRSQRLVMINSQIKWPPNVWMGVSVENTDYQYRIDDLRQTDANIKFLSLEPLLGPLDALDLDNIDWVIVGGESGPSARPMKQDWVEEIQVQCSIQKVPFFFKQWGGTNKKKTGRILHNRTWDEMPLAATTMT